MWFFFTARTIFRCGRCFNENNVGNSVHKNGLYSLFFRPKNDEWCWNKNTTTQTQVSTCAFFVVVASWISAMIYRQSWMHIKMQTFLVGIVNACHLSHHVYKYNVSSIQPFNIQMYPMAMFCFPEMWSHSFPPHTAWIPTVVHSVCIAIIIYKLLFFYFFRMGLLSTVAFIMNVWVLMCKPCMIFLELMVFVEEKAKKLNGSF